jgi:hypothetical protein
LILGLSRVIWGITIFSILSVTLNLLPRNFRGFGSFNG